MQKDITTDERKPRAEILAWLNQAAIRGKAD